MNPFNLLKPHYKINNKKYVVEKQIGEGAFAFVYHVKGTNKEDRSKSYAIKKLVCQSNEQLNEANKERLILNKIKNDYVIPLLGTDIMKNKKGYDEVILLLPLYDTSLQTIIDDGPSGYPFCSFIDGLDVVKILRNIAEGLAAVHAAGFRHCDLKPANILLTVDNMRAVLTDFGSASKLITVVNSRADALIVQDEAARYTTAPYRAPELFDTPSNCTITGASDIWSFGVLMYTMLFSRTPFETSVEGLSTLAVMSSTFPIVEGHCWPHDYIEIIDECLKVSCDDRISIEMLILKLKKLSSPPSSLLFTVIEKKHDTISALPSKVTSKIEKNSHNHHESKENTVFTDFADFEKFKISDIINNDDHNERISFGNFVSNTNTIDDEFGDFESSQPSVDDINKSSINKPTEYIDGDILVKQIITDSSINIIKQGPTFIMRPSGVFKKMTRKTVHIILSNSGLIIKKADSITAKIHYLLSFLMPISVVSTDTSIIGINGLIIDGYSVTIFMKNKANDNDDNNDINYTDFIDDEEEGDHLNNNSNRDSKNNNTFTKCRIIVSFESKELLSEWMDAIEYQHQQYYPYNF